MLTPCPNPTDDTTESRPAVSVVLPCLNEVETLRACITKAQAAMDRSGVAGEVVIADNGSTDGSQELAESLGARVVPVQQRGYGAALLGGFGAARGAVFVMADADDSYDLAEIPRFLDALNAGADFVIGTRFRRAGGSVKPGAMPFLHYWLGTPVLSFIARLFFGARITDINCGMRAFRRETLARMDLQMTGMEIASEMVIKAALLGIATAEVPITLHPAGRARPPHLRTWRDGWRHLRMMLLFSPRWLFVVPGLLLLVLGGGAFGALALGPVHIGTVVFDTNSMLVASLLVILGSQLVLLGVLAKSFVVEERLLPGSRLDRIGRALRLETGILAGLLLIVVGAAMIVWAVWQWRAADFGDLATTRETRLVVVGATLMVLGTQMASAGFFLGVLALRRRSESS